MNSNHSRRLRPILTTYELEQIANIYHRIKKASPEEVSDTVICLNRDWPVENKTWVLEFFEKLVKHATENSK